ncbi:MULTISPECIES: peptidoglycan editing factor PgeF [unclassified Saccharothrix]|uniref:peptidoglycan editing factor PgeF n=1 Tax=unclassified Saccharothrix TaxID=2593673 RepID=UPI00307D1394
MTRLAQRVRVAITDRSGGVGKAPFATRNLGGAVGDDPETVRHNRRRTATELGIDPDRVVFMHQVHGTDVAYVTEPHRHTSPPLDAVFTDRPGLALAVLVADCAPVLIADAEAGIVGAAHSGRVGTAAGVVPALVRAMVGHGAVPGRMTALVGPTACGLCYEVPAEMRDEFALLLPEARSTTRRGTPAIDVRAGVAAQLAAAGVADVRHDSRCTMESPELFSHRRDRPSGRFGAYIWLDA